MLSSSIAAGLLYLAYKLQYHYLFQISLRNWLWVLLAAPPAAALVRRLAWIPAISIALLAALLLLGVEASRRLGYMLFESAALDLGTGDQRPIDIEQEIPCRASGHFDVGGKQRVMVSEPAALLKLRTHERVVMARLKRTRFLLLARSAEAEAGCWYVFFTPERVLEIQTGYVLAGYKARHGLAVRYRPGEQEEPAVVFLGFDDLEVLQRALDDLRRDVPGERFAGL